MNKQPIYNAVIIALLIVSSFTLGYTYQDMSQSVRNRFASAQLSSEEGYLHCKNDSLPRTAQCLRNYVRSFYNYTIREDTIKSLEDIQQNGGDCYDYSNLYRSMGEELGLYAKVYRFHVNETLDHAVTILSSDEGYCLMDQQDYTCKYFEQGDEDE